MALADKAYREQEGPDANQSRRSRTSLIKGESPHPPVPSPLCLASSSSPGRHVEFYLWEHHKIPVLRATLAEIQEVPAAGKCENSDVGAARED
eukprot:322119-Hanusia_phi.AAC.7